MPEAIAVEAVPLISGEDGVIRVEGTRVPLETIVASFENGATAEEIAQQYPSVSLAAVYQVIGYYLSHKDELGKYLQKQSEKRAKAQDLNDLRWPPDGIRERLIAMRK